MACRLRFTHQPDFNGKACQQRAHPFVILPRNSTTPLRSLKQKLVSFYPFDQSHSPLALERLWTDFSSNLCRALLTFDSSLANTALAPVLFFCNMHLVQAADEGQLADCVSWNFRPGRKHPLCPGKCAGHAAPALISLDQASQKQHW